MTWMINYALKCLWILLRSLCYKASFVNFCYLQLFMPSYIDFNEHECYHPLLMTHSLSFRVGEWLSCPYLEGLLQNVNFQISPIFLFEDIPNHWQLYYLIRKRRKLWLLDEASSLHNGLLHYCIFYVYQHI